MLLQFVGCCRLLISDSDLVVHSLCQLARKKEGRDSQHMKCESSSTV